MQQRVAELIRIIDSLLIEMQTHMTHWTGFLDKLAVINMTHAQVGWSCCCHVSEVLTLPMAMGVSYYSFNMLALVVLFMCTCRSWESCGRC